MPTKKRSAKRRLDPRAEAELWGSVFDSGHDFFREIREVRLPAFRPRCDKADRAEAEAAWRRCGAHFLAARPANAHPPVPWALEQFGEPANG